MKEILYIIIVTCIFYWILYKDLRLNSYKSILRACLFALISLCVQTYTIQEPFYSLDISNSSATSSTDIFNTIKKTSNTDACKWANNYCTIALTNFNNQQTNCFNNTMDLNSWTDPSSISFDASNMILNMNNCVGNIGNLTADASGTTAAADCNSFNAICDSSDCIDCVTISNNPNTTYTLGSGPVPVTGLKKNLKRLKTLNKKVNHPKKYGGKKKKFCKKLKKACINRLTTFNESVPLCYGTHLNMSSYISNPVESGFYSDCSSNWSAINEYQTWCVKGYEKGCFS